MLLTFRDFELDTNLFTLRCRDQQCLVEPQVFDLMVYLAQRRDRIVSRQELLDALWAGKVVTDSTLSSCIKAARQALGDSGQAQNCIATLQRRGYRFVAATQAVAPAPDSPEPAMPAESREVQAPRSQDPRRASIAVMPFVDESPQVDARIGTGEALAHDITFGLAQLRSLFVIAQGSTKALSERRLDVRELGHLLNVDYVVSGAMCLVARRLRLTIELVETHSGRIVWTELFTHALDETTQALNDVSRKIVASVSSEVEMTERNRAILQAPNSLDAWEAHHRGLWHMYRFNQQDNQRAQHFFELAVRLDPTFSRAFAGLSFTHFQNAFQGWAPRAPEVDRAFVAASQSLLTDERNPAAHWAMGRALWLRDQHSHSVSELEQAVKLSPSFALAHYTLAFVHSQSGDPHAAISASDHSRLLSPFDPLLFGMLGARAIALVRLGQFQEASEWAVKAAARPNAHIHIHGVAAYSLALAGSINEARNHTRVMREAKPRYSIDDFIAAFRFDPQGAELFRKGAKLINS